jgi:tetratricopeptide (TPR) repeat protein
VRNADRCTALLAASRLSSFAYRFDHARAQLEESLEIARELGDPDMIGLRLDHLAYVCLQLRDLPAANRYADEVMTAAKAGGLAGRIGRTLLLFGGLRYGEGNLAEAQRCFDEALAIARELHYQRDAGMCLLQLSMVLIDTGQTAMASAALQEALAIHGTSTPPRACAAWSCCVRAWLRRVAIGARARASTARPSTWQDR